MNLETTKTVTTIVDEAISRRPILSRALPAGQGLWNLKNLSIVVGTVLTYVLNNHRNFNLGPIKASCTVGLLSAIFLPQSLVVPTFGGSFAGMARVAVIPSGIFPPLILGLLCSTMINIFDERKWFVGIGGRLGLMAQLACTIQFILSTALVGHRFPIVVSPAGGGAKLVDLAAYATWTKQRWISLLPLCSSTVLGALFMNTWKEAFTAKSNQSIEEMGPFLSGIACRLSTPVAAVGVTGLIMMSSIFSRSSIVGPAALCGAYVAMSSPQKIETHGELIGASIMAGICQWMLSGVLLGGWGGKLGTASLIGVLLYRALHARFGSFLSKSTLGSVAALSVP